MNESLTSEVRRVTAICHRCEHCVRVNNQVFCNAKEHHLTSLLTYRTNDYKLHFPTKVCPKNKWKLRSK